MSGLLEVLRWSGVVLLLALTLLLLASAVRLSRRSSRAVAGTSDATNAFAASQWALIFAAIPLVAAIGLSGWFS